MRTTVVSWTAGRHAAGWWLGASTFFFTPTCVLLAGFGALVGHLIIVAVLIKLGSVMKDTTPWLVFAATELARPENVLFRLTALLSHEYDHQRLYQSVRLLK